MLNDIISILTIGQIRDYEANSLFIQSLNNASQIQLVFAGIGPASDRIIKYVESNKIRNTFFTGRYNKVDEAEIVMRHHLINSFFEQDINSNTLLSNRFYLSVLLCRPLIINEGSYQSILVKHYNFGLVLKPDEINSEVITNYWETILGKCQKWTYKILGEGKTRYSYF